MKAVQVAKLGSHLMDLPHGWRRWAYSTNHKDIGTMYIVLSIVAGLAGSLLSVAMRAELAQPGLQVFTDAQFFNVIVSAHGISFAGFLVFLVVVWRTLSAGERCPANPWGTRATTLEWTLSSPPPFHSFDELPDLRGRAATRHR